MSILCKCKISGASWIVSSTLSYTAITVHPMLELSARQLITLWEQKGIVNKLDNDNTKLLSIALLLKTGLCVHDTKASIVFSSYPAHIAIQCIQPLITILAAVSDNQVMLAELPRYRISHYTGLDTIVPTLSNLPDVILVWQEEIREYTYHYRQNSKYSIERLDALSRLINCGTKPIKAARHLALYVAKATRFSTRKIGTSKGIMTQQEYWIELIVLCAQINNNDGFNVTLYGTELEDLHAVLEHLQDCSGIGDIFIYQAIALIKRGIASYQDIFAPVVLDSNTISREGQTIAINIQDSIVANMPQTKPHKATYTDMVEYYKALSAWELNKKRKIA